ncbi:MAG: TatD family hydrolase [Pseudomonadota bacterium]
MLIDSHCHLDMLDLTPYNGSLKCMIEEAKQNDVVYMLSAGVTLKDFPQLLAIAKQYDCVSCSVGLHPTEKASARATLEEIVNLAKHDKVVAIGETGLDYSYKEFPVLQQQEDFHVHLQAARASNKPLIIHSRQAPEDTLGIMAEEGADSIGGVMHCFTETKEVARAALDLGFYISISGIVTFKKAQQVQEVAAYVPIDRLLIETDAPYLAPVPHRGQPNVPAYVRFVAEFIANLRQVPYNTVAEHTTKNFCQLFGISLS